MCQVSCHSAVEFIKRPLVKGSDGIGSNDTSRISPSPHVEARASMTGEDQPLKEQKQPLKESVPVLREEVPSPESDGTLALVRELSTASTPESRQEDRDIQEIYSLKAGLQQFGRTDSEDVMEEVVDEELPDSQEVDKSQFKVIVDKGTLTLESSMNVSELLGPVPELPASLDPCSLGGTLPASSTSTVLPGYLPSPVMADCNPPTRRCLQSYLGLCRQRLLYTELECEYASLMYDFIEQGGNSGIERDQLKSIIDEYENGTIGIVQEEFGSCADEGSVEHTSLMDASHDSRGDFDATLISLINFEMVSGRV